MKSVYALLLFCGLSLFSAAQDCLQLTATEAFGVMGETVCVDFSANNFENVLTVQHTIEWDPQVLEFTEIIPDSNLPGLAPTNFGTLLTAQGLITYSWLDPNAGPGVTLPDGTPHYTICFEVIGTSGSQSAVRFTETNTAYEISQDDPPGFLFPPFNHLDGAFHYGAAATNLSLTDGCGINSDCGGGQSSGIDISVAGGLPPYTYVWEHLGTTVGISQDLNGIPQGYYTVTVTDAAGKEATGGFTVGAPVVNLVVDVAAINTSCPGGADGSISLQVLSGQAPYAFAWSNGSTAQDQTNLAAGLYQVTVSDVTGCSSIETIEIVDGPSLLIDGLITHPSCNQNDGSIDLVITGGTPPYTFTWSNGGSGSPLTNLAQGQYEVSATDINGCATVKTFYLNEIGGNGPTELIVDCVPGTDTGLIIMMFNHPTLINPPFTYTWSDGLVYVDDNSPAGTSTCARTDLPNGSYSVVITDAGGCTYQSPSYTINCTPGPEVCTEINIQDKEVGLPNLSFCVDVTADDLYDVKAMQLAFNYDPGLLSFTGIQNADPLEANGSVVNLSEPGPGLIHVIWVDFLLGDGVNMTDDGTLFTLCFDINNPGLPTYTTIQFSPGPLYPELTNSIGTVFPVACHGGRVGLYTSLNGFEWASCVQDGNCEVNGGAIYTEIFSTDDPLTYAWSGPDGFTSSASDYIGQLAPGIYELTITETDGETSHAVYNVPSGNDLLLGAVVTHPSCSGSPDGMVEALAMGGNPPYTFSINGAVLIGNVAMDLPPGVYYLSVEDSEGCSTFQQVFLSGNSSIDLSQSVVTCASNGMNGAIDLIVAGGSSPYQYQWSNGANSEDLLALLPGDYTVTVTDATLCTVSETFTVGNTTLELTDISTTCENEGQNNGAIDLTFSGGTAPLTFAWSNGGNTEDLTNVASGYYSLTVTDGDGCAQVFGPLLVCLFPDPNINYCLNFFTQSVEAMQGENVCVPVMVSGFTNVVSKQFSVNYDPNILLYTGSQNFNLPGLAPSNIGNPSAGNVIASWVSDDINNGTTVADNTVIYELCFDVIGATGYSEITFSGSPTPVEVNQNGLNIITPNFFSGLVSISSGTTPLQIVAECPTPAACSGGNDGGSISPTVVGGTAPYNFNWSGPNGFSSTAGSIQQLDPGIYHLTVTDLAGQTVSAQYFIDGAVSNIFDLSYTTIDCGTTVNIDLTVANPAITYDYLWSNNTTTQDLIGVPAGTYSVTVTDPNGCSNTATIDADFIPNYSSSILSDCISGIGPQYDIAIHFWSGLPANEAFTVIWSNGTVTTIPANGNSTTLQDVPSGIYSAVVTGSSGCTFNIDPIQLVGANLSSPADPQICPDGSTQLELQILGPPATITWTPATGLSCTDCPNPVAAPSETTFYQAVVDQGFACLEYVYVLVEVLDDCVWPGDTDTNKVVNHFDLLNVGLGFGQTGPPRPNASLNWEAQFAFDWTTSTPNSATNYKHADTDGNGLINSDDTLAISLNWGLTHNLQGPPSEKTQLPIAQNLGALPFYVAPDTLIEGEPASLGIILGESDSPANEVYGLAFSLTYDPSIVVPGSARVSLDNSWLGELNDDLISIQQNQVAAGRIDIGITRTDGQPITGFGEIARLEIVIEDNIFLHSQDPEKGLGVMEVVFGIENALLINHLEEQIGLNLYETVAYILDIENGLQELKIHNWSVQPNPSADNWTLSTQDKDRAMRVQVYQADARLVWEQADLKDSALTIPAAGWPAGTYSIQITTIEGIIHLKAIKL